MLLSLTLGLAMLQNPDRHLRNQPQERTVFQTSSAYTDRLNLRADVAIVYGFDAGMPARVKSWRDRGYKVHLMTGVAWGEYQDYYFGRWDGKNHEDEAQTRRNGEKVGHGRDVYYMSPGKDYGKYLAEGVRRALEVGVEAVHLEEPEFWEFGGYAEGFKREWQDYYGEAWQDPLSSEDARWRAAKLMYFLYRRALQQVFDSIQAYNREKGKEVRCYVPTHSLINYAHWGIVSPESSLAKLNGCDGYIAQVWTGTARTNNIYRNVTRERTFETAFLEYGSMQNLVRSTGRGVWYLADPIEDNPDHDWGDYRRNYHATLVASLLQPDVSQYEIMPWPERIYNGTYPAEENPKERVGIPAAYETELQVVVDALKHMRQSDVEWMCGSSGIGVAVSDTLMFQRGGPSASDHDMGQFYGLALPFVKRGMPVQPIQLENVGLPGYLDNTKVLLLSYEGQKPMGPEVHGDLAKWVRAGGNLVVVDDDRDPFHRVREWWNTGGMDYRTPRQHLFQRLGLTRSHGAESIDLGKGRLIYLRKSPNMDSSRSPDGDRWLAGKVQALAKGFDWKESSSLAVRRGPFVVAAGMDETESPVRTLRGEYVDLFDPELRVQTEVVLGPGSRHFLIDLRRQRGAVVASAGETIERESGKDRWVGTIEGQAETEGVLLLRAPRKPKSSTVGGNPVEGRYDAERGLLLLRFPSTPRPQTVDVRF